MITLITGVPGAGKTLHTLARVDNEYSTLNKPDGTEVPRAIFYAGITDCQMEGWTEITHEQAREWRDFEDSSVFVIDECDLWASNSTADRKLEPEWIKELRRHRHRGFDFILITQKPTYLHHVVRGLVGKHYHYVRNFGQQRSTEYMWERAVDDPNDRREQRGAVKTPRPFPKKYFEKYKSAEVHTHKRKYPWKVYASVAFILLTVGGLMFAGSRVLGYQDRVEAMVAGDVGQDVQNPPGGFGLSILGGGNQEEVITPEQYALNRLPRIQDVPWSSPMYDEVREVQSYPRPQCMFVIRTGDCSCYTQQATPLAISYEQCRNIVDNGYFNPFIEDRALLAAQQQPESPGPGPGAAEQSHINQTIYVSGNFSESTEDLIQRAQDILDQPSVRVRAPGRVASIQNP